MLAKFPFDYVVFTKIDEVTINVFLTIIRSLKIEFFFPISILSSFLKILNVDKVSNFFFKN
jgi:hypothetical protein